MRVTISKLDVGYLVKVTHDEERKTFAFERLMDATDYIRDIMRDGADAHVAAEPPQIEPFPNQNADVADRLRQALGERPAAPEDFG